MVHNVVKDFGSSSLLFVKDVLLLVRLELCTFNVYGSSKCMMMPPSLTCSFNTVERVREVICFLSLCLLLLVSVVVDVVFLLLGVLVVGKFLELFLKIEIS